MGGKEPAHRSELLDLSLRREVNHRRCQGAGSGGWGEGWRQGQLSRPLCVRLVDWVVLGFFFPARQIEIERVLVGGGNSCRTTRPSFYRGPRSPGKWAGHTVTLSPLLHFRAPGFLK